MLLNDHSSALSLLATRRSGRPREMVAPGPSPDQLDQILTIASRTPDHGKLTPWRFVIVSAEQRAALAMLLAAALPESDPAAGDAHFAKTAQFAHQAPTLVVLVSCPIEGHKIPIWEQRLSCGAVGMNLLHGAHALGFVGSWITGWAAYSPRVHDAFCRPGEEIAGFFFLGTPGAPLEERPRPALSSIASDWTPPQG
ncbi:nitroreductase [Sphingomonas sp. LY160]|uniref:nitroreductase family protein n=1 Tax=Sphingomonas sp. LY160 TaxID=3095342 RepID=UPI002ADED629|nr:nitroreductase [Sphingomonas sp. LY160]MEA1070990.1 nitroreductase [Sphingomonas sp. LY160]